MKRLRDLSLSSRLMGIVALLLLGLGLALSVMIPRQQERALADRITGLKVVVQAAIGVATELQHAEASGTLTHEQALAEFRRVLRSMRYGQNGYLYAATLEGVHVVQPPQPEYEGVNRIDARDGAGHYYIRDLIAAARAGGGVTHLVYPKPGTDIAADKVNYVEPFLPWNLFVGTGVFTDDMAAENRAILVHAGTFAAVSSAVIIGLAWLVSRAITRRITRLTATMTALAAGDDSVEIVGADQKDEIGRMTAALCVFKAATAKAKRLTAERELAEAQLAATQREVRQRTADQFEQKVGSLVSTLSISVTDLEQTALAMTGTAKRTTAQAERWWRRRERRARGCRRRRALRAN